MAICALHKVAGLWKGHGYNMDIKSTLQNADYLEMQKSQAGAKVEQQLKKDYSNATDQELMDACKQFESYLLEQVFKEMEKTIPKDEETGDDANGQLVDYFKGNMLQEITSSSVESGGFGIAQSLYEQMKRNYSI